jgi:hypothetical protein
MAEKAKTIKPLVPAASAIVRPPTNPYWLKGLILNLEPARRIMF